MASVEGRAETLISVHSTLRESFLASDIAENNQIPRSLARVTLAAVLNDERSSNANSDVVRTILDIINAEETLANHPTSHNVTGKNTWRLLKERLRLRRNQNDWMSAAPVPQPDPMAPLPQLQILSQDSLGDLLGNSSTRRADPSGAEALPSDDMAAREEGDQRRRSIRLSDALAAEREETRSRQSRELDGAEGEGAAEAGSSDGGDVNVGGGAGSSDGGDVNVGGGEPAQEEPIRMSLMELLEESERQARIQGPIYRFDDDEDEENGEDRNGNENEEEAEKERRAGVGEASCCVCMVRHKGAAFIPCGHTFCRMCSRELWVQRGHCPLCNNFILEVLDIF